MNNILNTTLDVIDYIINDNLEKLAETVETLSDFAKKAYIPTVEEANAMPDKQFGLVLWHPTLGTFHKFAMGEPGITEININLLANNMETMPDEVVKIASANLTCAARKFRIPIPEKLEKTASKKFVKNILDIRDINEAAFITKTATFENKRYCLPSEKKYPINTKDELLKAAEYFNVYGDMMAISTKQEFLENLNKVAEEFSVRLTKYPNIEKYAILDTSKFNEDFKYHITSRISFLKESQANFRELYQDLINRSKTLGTEKTAAVLEVLDKKTGLSAVYGRGLQDPMVSTFGIRKEAAVSFEGTAVTLGKLRSIPNEDLTSIVGNGAIKDLKGEDGLEVFASLPTPVKKEVTILIK